MKQGVLSGNIHIYKALVVSQCCWSSFLDVSWPSRVQQPTTASDYADHVFVALQTRFKMDLLLVPLKLEGETFS